ncbi:MAG TPA: beta-glucosidase [Ruminococcaceae bacterium]|nr:beta-glucosidase [Oscillospiraceae bacterium]HCK49537.1 beta-glucosidase [Oscillospiraceae bacterium]
MKRTLDWDKYLETSARAVSGGIVMLKNDGALPLKQGGTAAVFGRIQLHYYKSGTGSGGMVNVSKVIGITDGLLDAGYKLDEQLLNAYREWDEQNPFDYGEGWGGEPWSQKEMPLTDELVGGAASRADAAIVIIGRTAGEEMDNKLEKGAFLLSDLEEDMLRRVTSAFDKTVVLLNTGGLIDMSFMDRYPVSAVMYVWQGGMVGGAGTAAVLTGEVSPSGKLPDTIAYEISDYPSDKFFGSGDMDCYGEDIYVGYRYFETFAKDRVRFPFGFGMSYTSFDITASDFKLDGDKVTGSVNVKNTGSTPGREVVQIYCSAPQGKLGKPARVLCGFDKTRTLQPGESQTLSFEIPLESVASYDDSGVTGHKSAWILEQGGYVFYAGADVRSASEAYSLTLPETVVRQCKSALGPLTAFKRMVNSSGKPEFEDVPLTGEAFPHDHAKLPAEIPQTGDRGIRLADVVNGKNTLEEFTAQLTDYDLSCIIRGEGMGSPKVTAGTAAAFGGVSDTLTALGIPCACCDDGPSGMRLDCGTKAFSLPNGTLLASTFDRPLMTELFTFMGLEMHTNQVDCLLGPGMNIHRHPLNGRNFEYFSEDPYLTGEMASAELAGLHSTGAEGTIKHFCGNNRETRRHFLDSVISERALREIYLRGFENAVKKGGAKSVMTTYGQVNGVWTAGNYDLVTGILRDDWGFDGFTMTDWWANINRRGKAPDKSDFAAMAMAQNDVYMVTADGAACNDNTLDSLKSGELTRGELQRNAMNILRFLTTTHAMKRVMGCDDETEIINRPADAGDVDSTDIEFHDIDEDLTLDLTGITTEKGSSYAFGLNVSKPGVYKVTLTASSTLSELAQTSVSIFALGSPCGMFTFNGTGGAPVSQTKDVKFLSNFMPIRLYFGGSGLKTQSIRFELKERWT